MADEKKPQNLIIDPNDIPNEPQRPFGELLDHPEDAQLFFSKLQDAIARSFVTDAMNNPFRTIQPTRDELKHRFKICEAWFRYARGDLGYSVDKACDHMAAALRAELDGKVYDPGKSDGRIWTPT